VTQGCFEEGQLPLAPDARSGLAEEQPGRVHAFGFAHETGAQGPLGERKAPVQEVCAQLIQPDARNALQRRFAFGGLLRGEASHDPRRSIHSIAHGVPSAQDTAPHGERDPRRWPVLL
jgi:hypothetical protein